jgi:hypothetical protein
LTENGLQFKISGILLDFDAAELSLIINSIQTRQPKGSATINLDIRFQDTVDYVARLWRHAHFRTNKRSLDFLLRTHNQLQTSKCNHLAILMTGLDDGDRQGVLVYSYGEENEISLARHLFPLQRKPLGPSSGVLHVSGELISQKSWCIG